jgi:putative Holliday junction resolvase
VKNNEFSGKSAQDTAGSSPESVNDAAAFRRERSTKRRVLALDLGKKRIGLALSDPLGITAQGLPTLERTNIRQDLAALARLAEEHHVGLILVGYPLHMSGREGRQVEYARDFASRLAERTGLEVRFWDERLTTVEAQRVLKSSGISIAKRARAVDQLAAQILLESYLDSEAHA